MAVTKGHGNPNWTREEVILALDLYHDCGGRIPSEDDIRVRELSKILRAFPHHSVAARMSSFRNPAGVAFKLQNLHKVATGKGLGNVSVVDREVWEELGSKPESSKALAELIKAGLQVVEEVWEDMPPDEVFAEGRVVTETHLRRERRPELRARLLADRRAKSLLKCEMCDRDAGVSDPEFAESIFEVHHVVPLSLSGERKTKLSDLALLCACCHRLIHKAIAVRKCWFSIHQARELCLK